MRKLGMEEVDCEFGCVVVRMAFESATMMQ